MTLNFDDLLGKAGDHLIHYGVPGMKWGIRKAGSIRAGLAERRANRKAPTHPDRAAVNKLKKKPLRTLSNKQITQVNKRLEMEKKMSQLKLDNAKLIKGNNALKAVLAVGTTVTSLYALSTTPAGKAAIAAGKKLITGGS
jgi:hypothetical protein